MWVPFALFCPKTLESPCRRWLLRNTLRANWLCLSICFVLLCSCRPASDKGERMPIYVSPFYNSEVPEIAVGKHSARLADANRVSIEAVTAAMKSDWNELRPEAMYVAAVRLYDLGLKDEAVYWFYSAQYRAMLFHRLLVPEHIGSLGSEAFELVHAYSAFHQLTGIYINGYAFQHRDMLTRVIERVQAENARTPDFSSMYPNISFVEKSDWADLNREVNSGMTVLLDLVAVNLLALRDGDSRAVDVSRAWSDPQVAELATAAVNGDIARIDQLVAAGVDVNAQGRLGLTPLYFVYQAKNKAGFARLLQHGASPNIETWDGDSVIHSAAEYYRDCEWLDLALKHGGDPNLPRSLNRFVPDRPPIFEAILIGNARAVELLIEAGADLRLKDDQNKTPLECAISSLARFEVIYHLLQAGADFRATAKCGKTLAEKIKERALRHASKTVWHDRVLEFLEEQANEDAAVERTEADKRQ